MSLTIEQLKSNKSKLEESILKQLRDFEKESEILISYVNVRIDSHSYEKLEKNRKKEENRKLKGVLDVTIDVNIENDPRSIDSTEAPNA